MKKRRSNTSMVSEIKKKHWKRKRSMCSILILPLLCFSNGVQPAKAFAPNSALSNTALAKAMEFRQQRNGKSHDGRNLLLRASTMGNDSDSKSRTWIQSDRFTRNKNNKNSRKGYSATTYTQRERRNDITAGRTKMKPMPITGYDARAIEELYDRRPFQVGWRLNILGFPLLGWYLNLLLDKTLGVHKNEDIQRKRGQEFREHLVNSGSVALIKSGQALSLRPDLLRNKIWAEELGKLVDAVGSFSDMEAMKIMKSELKDLTIRMKNSKPEWETEYNNRKNRISSAGRGINRRLSKVEKFVQNDSVLSLFEFYNSNQAVASASIGQVYKAKIRKGAQLEAAIGKEQAAIWGGKVVAIKVQRPDACTSASLDMYLLRKLAKWLSKFRGGDLPAIADQFGMQLFGELDYVREANNCERFRELYGSWKDVEVPRACETLTRKKVLVMEWVEGTKGPWINEENGDKSVALDMVSIGLRCSVDQLMNTGLFHADPHRGNMLKTPEGKLAFIDFGMMADINEDDRYGLFGAVIGLSNKDLPLVTENLLKLGFLEDTTQLDQIIPRLRAALLNSTGGSGKASDVNFARLQAELDEISRENVLRFSTPPFFTIIIRSLTILEGVALGVDPNFRLVRGAYPYVLRQLLYNETAPMALQKLLIRLLTVEGEGLEIEWERLRDFLRLAQTASKKYVPSPPKSGTNEAKEKSTSAMITNGAKSSVNVISTDVKGINEKLVSRETIELFFEFLTSRTGIFIKKPLVHELAEFIDSMASNAEKRIQKSSNGLIPLLPGMNGPVNVKRMDEMQSIVDIFEKAMFDDKELATANYRTTVGQRSREAAARFEAMVELLGGLTQQIDELRKRDDAGPLLEEIQSVIQLVTLEVLEIRGSRAMREILSVGTT